MTLIRPMSLLLLSALLFSCGKETADKRREIRFSPSVSVETKTAYKEKPDDPTVLINVGNEACVFGTRIENPGVSETPYTVFSKTRLHCDGVNTPLNPADSTHSFWNYSPLKYWEDTGSYYFAAVFPYLPDNTTIDNAYFVSVQYQAGANRDLMVARAYRDVETKGFVPVNLEFKHSCAAVRFLFGKSSSSALDNYSLTEFQVMNLRVAGTLKVPSRISENQNVVWGNWTQGATGNLSSIAALPLSVPHPEDSSDPDDYVQIGWYYMVPQDLSADSAVKFSVSYNNEAPVTTILNISDRDGVGGVDRWLPNCVYNYYITFTQTGMNLAVKTIPWDEVQVTTDPFDFEF